MQATVLIILLNVFLATTAWSGEKPQQALSAIQQAIDNNDPVLLEQRVDVRGIIAKGVDVFIADYGSNPPGGEGDPLMEMLSGGLAKHSQTAASQQMKVLLVEETRKFVIRGVASGSFSGRPAADAVLPDGGILAALFDGASTARKELRQARIGQIKGDKAMATARVYDFGSERHYPVQLDLTRQPDGYWKVTGVRNMAELIRTVRNEANAW